MMNGFESGALRAELFADVLPALEKWKASGLDLRISATVVMGTSSCVMGQAPISAQAERDCKP